MRALSLGCSGYLLTVSSHVHSSQFTHTERGEGERKRACALPLLTRKALSPNKIQHIRSYDLKKALVSTYDWWGKEKQFGPQEWDSSYCCMYQYLYHFYWIACHCVNIPQFVYIPVGRCLGCFWFLSIINKGLCIFMYKCLCGHMCSFLLGINFGVKLLGHQVCMCLMILKFSHPGSTYKK